MTIPFPGFLSGAGAARSDVDKTWGDLITLSKTTSLVKRKYITRNKSLVVLEGWNLQQTARSNIDKTWGDAATLSKTTGLVGTNYPKDLYGVLLEDPDCPDVYLTWDVGPYTSYTMTLQRRTSSVWYDVDTNIAAGTEDYTDTGVTEGDTDRWRIKFNGLSGAEYTESNLVNTICPT